MRARTKQPSVHAAWHTAYNACPAMSFTTPPNGNAARRRRRCRHAAVGRAACRACRSVQTWSELFNQKTSRTIQDITFEAVYIFSLEIDEMIIFLFFFLSFLPPPPSGVWGVGKGARCVCRRQGQIFFSVHLGRERVTRHVRKSSMYTTRAMCAMLPLLHTLLPTAAATLQRQAGPELDITNQSSRGWGYRHVSISLPPLSLSREEEPRVQGAILFVVVI